MFTCWQIVSIVFLERTHCIFLCRVLGWNWQKLQPKIKKTITLKNSIVTCYIAWKRQRWVQWNSVLTAWRATDILYTGNAMRAQFTCLTMDSLYCTSNEHNKWKHFWILVPLWEYKSLDVNSLVTVGRIELHHGDTCCYTSHCWNCWNVMWLTFPRTTLTWLWLDSEDDYHSGSQNVSHQEQSIKRLPSPRQSC